MKFNCGKTIQKRVKDKEQWRNNWHKWFALIPRKVGPEECRVFEYIERKGESYTGYRFGTDFPVKVKKWRYEYRVAK